jgi:soluble lytic murein transglycosylase
VRYRSSQGKKRFTWVCVLLAMATQCTAVVAQSLADQRSDYAEAVQAIDRGQWMTYETLRPALDDYPLAIYLDYFQLTRQPGRVDPAHAQAFLLHSVDTPLPNRFLAIYLREAGSAQRWQDFVQVMPEEPNSVVLKCYYFRAQLAQGNKEVAWNGAQELWVYGKSQPKECDPLFKAWQSAGQLTDEIVWTRMLNAYAARQPALMGFVGKKGSAALQPWVKKLRAVYANPGSLTRMSLPADNAYSSDIVVHGLAYLATYSPQKALSDWVKLQPKRDFSPEQVSQVEYAIARQTLLSRTAANNDWLEGALARLGDDKLIGIRLRWALKEQDWAALERNLSLLSTVAKEETVWLYWLALVQEWRGEDAAARFTLERLAGERDYYGFRAADKLGLTYELNHETLVMDAASPVQDFPALQRIEELKFQQEDRLAHSEWYALLQATEDLAQQQNLALLATQNGWYRMAIDAATRAKVWNALDQRFPTPYQDIFKRHAATHDVPRTELMSIARRESAFFPGAQSPVGARGLMQIMPATAKQVAASLKQPHTPADLFEVEHNVLLGSAYYRQVLARFGGNRVFALAAYNAGPHRVDRWRSKPGEGVPVEVWIETIPYRETRNYVQAVLAYNVVFQYLLGDTQRLFTPLERQARY